ncbi:glycosyltransferase family 4 protein [Pedobacter sp. PLR]|uniref:glycosyltransferase family 4 protein n=1 Tax=Pedobacter sp. PLR TaxID=2994465 RepID=UPI0022453A26|nr:glycosyltransferase family 4 protein [Pedobacter sp. PLR]MCX2453368.1 glycosyltransferase family 4 protein [Pedobacter sp. PLR]
MSKKVAFLDLSPFFGGGQKFLLTIQKYLSDKDSYYFLVKDKNTFDQLLGENKCLIESDNLLSQIGIVNDFILQNGIDVIILNGNRPIYFSPFIRVKNKIAYKHTSNNAFRAHRRILGHLLLNVCYLFCNRIVLLFEDAITEVFWNKKKVRIINNGVESPRDLKDEKKSSIVNVLCVSRLDSNKGVDWLVKVFLDTFGGNKDIQLTIAGFGPLYEYLNDYIGKGTGNIKLLGFVDDIPSELFKADVFVLPSKFESFPLSILEAMSFGLPIIATDTGGVKEMVIESQNGYLINYLNDRQLKDSLLSLCNNTRLRASYGYHSSEIFNEKFIITKCVEKIEKLVYEI